MEYIIIRIGKNMLESGKIKKSMVMVNFIGMTEKNILVFIKKIKEKDLASIANLIKYFILVFGKMEKEMVLENISKGKILNLEYGKMEVKINYLKIIKNFLII